MSNLHNLAIGFILVFLAFLVVVGIWAGRKNKAGSNNETVEYFLGGKSTPMIVLAMSYAASAVSAGSFIGDPGVMSTVGWPYYWIAIATVAGTAIPGIWIIRKMRLQSEKFGSLTVIDYCSKRYQSPKLKVYLSLLMVICFLFTMVAQFKGAAILLEMYTGISFNTGLVVMLVVVVFFVNSGGLRSVAWTDFFMGCFMTVMSVTLVIAAISYIGGFNGMEAALDADHPTFNQVVEQGSESEALITWFGLPMLFIYGFFIMFSQPYITARYIALPDVNKKSVGKFLIIAIVTAMLFNFMFIVGMAGRVGFPDAEGDYMTVTVSTEIFPPIIACVIMIGFFSAIVSTATSILLVVGQAIGGDIYGKFAKKSTPKKEIRVTQISTIVIALIVFAFNMVEPPAFLQVFIYLGLTGVGSSMCMSLYCGVLWKKSRREGAWAAAILGPVSYLLWTEVWGLSWASGMGIAVVGAAIGMFGVSWILNAVKGPDKELMEWADPFIDPK